MSDKFTRGPWRAGIPGNPRVYAPDGHGEESGPIVEVLPIGDFEKQAANKHLIAAAPDLFFVLNRIVGDLPEKRDWLDPMIERCAKAAIRKARGE